MIQLAAGQYLTTGDLDPGDSGDAGNLYEMAVEFWFKSDTVTPAGGDTIIQGPVGTADGSNRQWLLSLGATGLVSFVLRSDSLTTSTVTAPAGQELRANTWYHIVGMVYGSTSHAQALFINGVNVIQTTAWNDKIRHGLTAGSADMRLGDSAGVSVFSFAHVAFYRQAMTAARVLAHYVAGTQRGFPQQLASPGFSGAPGPPVQPTVPANRVSAVLDTIGSSAERRLEARGGADVNYMTPRYMTGQAPLDAIREAVAAENIDAAFFVAADGALIFLGSDIKDLYSTSSATFDDSATAGLYYVDLSIDYSDSFIVNEVNVTREGTSQAAGVTQTASNAASIARYGKRSQSLSGLPVVDDATALSIANALLAKYKDPMLRIQSLTLTTDDPATAQAALALELGYKITVKRQPPGGGAQISQDLWIQKIEVSGANDGQPWNIRFSVSPV